MGWPHHEPGSPEQNQKPGSLAPSVRLQFPHSTVQLASRAAFEAGRHESQACRLTPIAASEAQGREKGVSEALAKVGASEGCVSAGQHISRVLTFSKSCLIPSSVPWPASPFKLQLKDCPQSGRTPLEGTRQRLRGTECRSPQPNSESGTPANPGHRLNPFCALGLCLIRTTWWRKE